MPNHSSKPPFYLDTIPINPYSIDQAFNQTADCVEIFTFYYIIKTFYRFNNLL